MNTNQRALYLGLIPVVLLIILILVFWMFIPSTAVYEPPYLLAVLNAVFLFFVSCIVAYMAMRSYVIGGSPAVLFLGSGVLAVGMGALVAGWMMGSKGPDANVTIFNVSCLLGSICFTTGVIVDAREMAPEIGLVYRKLLLSASYLLILFFVVLLSLLSFKGITPHFFIQGVGPTPVRQVVVAVSLVLFLISSVYMMKRFIEKKVSFLYWYSLALMLLALAMIGVLLQPAVGSHIGWVGRTAQYMAGVYFFVSVFSALRDAKSRGVTASESISELFRNPVLHWQDIMATVSDAIVSIDDRGRILLWNDSAVHTFGYSKAEALGKDLDIILTDDRRIEMISLFRADESRSSITEMDLRKNDGSSFSAEISASIQNSAVGKIATLVIRDITERKQAHEALDKVKYILSEGQKIAHVGTFEYIADTRTTVWSEEEYRIYGLDPTGPSPAYDVMLEKSIHPDDATLLHQTFTAAMQSGSIYELEHRIVRPDGSVRWVYDRAHPYFDENGKLVQYIGTTLDITERKHAEEVLQRREREFAAMFEQSSVGMSQADPRTSRLLRVNKAFADMLGYSQEEMHRMTFIDITYPEDLERDLAGYAPVRTGDANRWEIEKRYLRKDGKVLWANVSGNLIRGDDGSPAYTIAVIEDITERKMAEETLRESRNQFMVLTQNVDAGVALVDDHGRFSIVNPAFLRMFDIPSDSDIRNVNDRDWGQWQVFDENGDLLEVDEHPVRKAAISGKAIRNRLVAVKSPSGDHLKWILISAEPVLKSDGRMESLICTYTDITERKQAEEALKHYSAQLEEANRELESFSYSVSHDLRAPLRAIDGYARLILKKQGDKFDEDTLRRFKDIRLNAQMMGKLIDDLLTFSRLSRKEMSRSDLNMVDLIREVWKELININPDRNMNLTVNSMPLGYGDAALVKQVYHNLLSNAVKFTKSRDYAQIEVGGYNDGNENVFYVKDNGIGFDMKYYDKLFGVFQRLHNDPAFEGTGVGLATVQRIVHKQGGRVWAEGEVNEGATFYFTLHHNAA